MATERLYRVRCDGDCGRVGNLVGASSAARRTGNANGIRRVVLGTFTLNGEAPGPFRRAEAYRVDLCPFCLKHRAPEMLAARVAYWARHNYLPLG